MDCVISRAETKDQGLASHNDAPTADPGDGMIKTSMEQLEEQLASMTQVKLNFTEEAKQEYLENAKKLAFNLNEAEKGIIEGRDKVVNEQKQWHADTKKQFEAWKADLSSQIALMNSISKRVHLGTIKDFSYLWKSAPKLNHTIRERFANDVIIDASLAPGGWVGWFKTWLPKRLEGPFSAGSKPTFATNVLYCSIFQDPQN